MIDPRSDSGPFLEEVRSLRETVQIVKDDPWEAEHPAMGRLIDRELMMKTMPIIRKVVLNPKIYLYYDYVVSNLGYKRDIGDFLADAVEDYFASRGYKILIQKTSEVEVQG